MLLTCCKDSVCRLWAETLLPGDSLLSGHHGNHVNGQHGDPLLATATGRKASSSARTQNRKPQEVRQPIRDECFLLLLLTLFL